MICRLSRPTGFSSAAGILGAGLPAMRPGRAAEISRSLSNDHSHDQMDEKPMMIWASHYLSAMAKALMDDAELGMMH